MNKLFWILVALLAACSPKIQKTELAKITLKRQHVLVTYKGQNPQIITDTFYQSIHFSDTNFKSFILSDTAVTFLSKLRGNSNILDLQVSLATFLELEAPNCVHTIVDLNDSMFRNSTLYFEQVDSILKIFKYPHRKANLTKKDTQLVKMINVHSICTDPMKIIYDVLQSTFLKSMHCVVAPNPVHGAFKFKFDCDLSPNFMPNGLKVEFVDNYNRPLTAAIMKPGEWRTFDFPKNMNGQQMIFYRIFFLQTAYKGEFMKMAN